MNPAMLCLFTASKSIILKNTKFHHNAPRLISKNIRTFYQHAFKQSQIRNRTINHFKRGQFLLSLQQKRNNISRPPEIPVHAGTIYAKTRQHPEEMYEYESRLIPRSEQDAKVIFELIFAEICKAKGGDQNMVFPKDIMWLCGAPGAGKGEMSRWIMYQRGYHADPIKISQILTGEEIEKLKASGKLVSDRIVLTILLEKLLLPEYRTGVIVDGFPRTKLQAECIKLLFDRMLLLRRKYDNTEHFVKFRRPKFHITVLYVDKPVSIQRQLGRGKALQEHNDRVKQTGIGELVQIRDTDVCAEKAEERYKYFHEHIYQAIQSTKEKFPFHFISAEAPIEVVKERILKELEYQSSAELADETFDMVRQVSLASEIKLNARHKLVTRLDSYSKPENKDLFQRIIDYFKKEFEPLVRQQSLVGTCIVSTEDKIFDINDGIGLTMMLDLLAERGYRVILDVSRDEKAVGIDEKNRFIYEPHRVYKFHITFPPPKMRHAMQTYETDISVTQ